MVEQGRTNTGRQDAMAIKYYKLSSNIF